MCIFMVHTTSAVGSLGELLSTVKRIRKTWASNDNPREEIWFRGHGRHSDQLLPTLYRSDSLASSFHEKENSLLTDFRLQAKSHIHATHTGDLDKWFWYVTARHHGLPSRLLDWSSNLLIALYFALEESWNVLDKKTWSEFRCSTQRSATKKEPPSIWVLEAASLNQVSQRTSAVFSFETKDSCLPLYYPDSNTGFIKPYRRNRLPIAMYPGRFTARVHSQHSFFTLHGTDKLPLERIATQTRQGRNSVLLAQIPIKKSRIPYLIDDLVLCGVSSSAIYADLDSIAKTVKWSFMEQGSLRG